VLSGQQLQALKVLQQKELDSGDTSPGIRFSGRRIAK